MSSIYYKYGPVYNDKHRVHFLHRYLFLLNFCEGIKLRYPGLELFTIDYCPGDRGLHQVSHHQKVNVPGIPEERGVRGFQMTRALS